MNVSISSSLLLKSVLLSKWFHNTILLCVFSVRCGKITATLLRRGEGTQKSCMSSKCCKSQRGQAMTEYIMLVVLVALVLIPVLKLFPKAVQGYVRPFYYCISRPIP